MRQRSFPDTGKGGKPFEGDTNLTDPRKYRSKQRDFKWGAAAALQKMNHHMSMTDADHRVVGPSRTEDLKLFDNPRTDEERRVAEAEDRHAIGLRMPEKISAGKSKDSTMLQGVSNPITRHNLAAVDRADIRRERLAARFPMLPSDADYHRLAHKLKKQETDDQRAERLHERLAKEFGIFGRDRVDAYMLDDETIFPAWVKNLEPSLRSKVMYGSLGITEHDEVLRQNLLSLPLDARREEWARIKAARSYERGEERMLSPQEIRDERLGKRRMHWLARKMLNKQALIRRLGLKRPDQWGLPAAKGLDLSHRLSVVARHLEAKVQTKGEWPLDESRLAAAQRRLERNAAKESFIFTGGSPQGSHVSQALREAVKKTSGSEKGIKTISKRRYSFRLQAVKDGNQDEHGRKFIDLSRHARMREMREYSSVEAMAMDRRIAHRPNLREGDRRPAFVNLANRYDGKSFAFQVDSPDRTTP